MELLPEDGGESGSLLPVTPSAAALRPSSRLMPSRPGTSLTRPGTALSLCDQNGLGEDSMTSFFHNHMRGILQPFAENLDELQKYVSRMGSNLVDVTTKTNGHHALLQEHGASLGSQRADLDRISEQAKAMEVQMQSTMAEKAALEADYETTKATVSHTEDRCNSMQAAIEELQTVLKDTRVKGSRCREAQAECDRTIAHIQQEMGRFSEVIANLTAAHETTSQNLDHARQDIANNLRDFKYHVKSFSDDCINRNAASQNIEKLISKLDEDATDLRRRLQFQEENSESQDGTMQQIKERLAAHDLSREELREMHNKLEVRITGHDVRANAFEESIEVLLAFMKRVTSGRDLNAVIDSFSDTLKQHGEDIHRLRELTTNHTAKLELDDGLISTLDEAVDRLQARAKRLEKVLDLEPLKQGDMVPRKVPKNVLMTPEQLAGCENAFKEFDENGDGTITVKELGIAMGKLGQSPPIDVLQDMVDEADTDGSGAIDFPEFCQLVMRWGSVNPDKVKEQALKNMEFMAKQRQTAELVAAHTVQLRETEAIMEQEQAKLSATSTRLQDLTDEYVGTVGEVRKLRQGLDLSQEYWKGLSRGLKETRKNVQAEGEHQIVPSAKRMSMTLPPLSRQATPGSLTAR